MLQLTLYSIVQRPERKKADQSKNILKELQGMFSDDHGWDSEESMIADMAAFRRKRLKIMLNTYVLISAFVFGGQTGRYWNVCGKWISNYLFQSI